MKKLIASLMFVTLAFCVMPVVAKRHHDTKVAINKEVTVKGGLKIAFVELIEDSRCPTDANCIWAGNAKIKVRITPAGGAAKVIELNTTTSPQSAVVGKYEVKLTGLTPEPASNIRIRKDGYVATFAVTKST